jgi:flagellar FliL protein
LNIVYAIDGRAVDRGEFRPLAAAGHDGYRAEAVNEAARGKSLAEREDAMNKKAIIIIAGIMFVFMALVGGGFYMMWVKIVSLMPPEEVIEEVVEEEEEEEEAVVIGEMFPLDPFVVNLADGNGKRYLRATLQLELAPEQAAATFEQRLPQIRDVVLTILSTKEFENIRTADGKMSLRTEIIARLNELLNSESVANLYFTDFVIQ